ncbi:LLM class flavin-dependent oxidoreductase [Pseudonocardia alni]|uniref:LLM class flavin-dependent oxidoreductase n=1 Tax=Pseudonocardia alni TaxID=33907 RepID=UPI00367F7722
MTMKVSLLQPFVPSDPADVHPAARLVADSLGLTRLWLGQSWTLDPAAICAHLAGAGVRVPIGVGVLISSVRRPVQAALEARTIAVVTGHAPCVAFGPGSVALQSAVLGSPLRRPVAATSRYLAEVRRELGLPAHAGDPPGRPVRLPPSDAPPPQLGLGVLREAMAEEAGRSADVAVLWMTPPAYVASAIVPALDRGARRAGRARPHIVVIAPTAPDVSQVDPVTATHLAVGGHLLLEHYRDMLCRAGLTVTGDAPSDAARLLSGGVVLHGTSSELAEGVRRFAGAGVDELVINAAGVHHLGGAAAVGTSVSAVVSAAMTAGLDASTSRTDGWRTV